MHTTPAIRTLADGLSDGLAGRRECLQAIGNSVSPQVVLPFAEAIKKIMTQ